MFFDKIVSNKIVTFSNLPMIGYHQRSMLKMLLFIVAITIGFFALPHLQKDQGASRGKQNDQM